MALFHRLKQMLMPKEKREKKEYLIEKQDADSQDTLPANEKQNVAQNGRQARVAQLTPHEHDLYLLLLEGFTLKESAKQLGVKYSTANTHITSLYKKLEIKTRAELIINYRGLNKENYDE